MMRSLKAIVREEKKTLLFFLVAAILRIASGPTGVAAFLLLAAYSLRGRRQAVLSLAACWLFQMLNPSFFPIVPYVSILRYLVIFVVALSVVARINSHSNTMHMSRFAVLTIALGVFIFCHSLAVSSVPVVSILKGVNWSVAVWASAAAWGGMPPDMRERTARSLYVLLAIVYFLSLPTLTLPGAYLIHGSTLFKGILVHSQSFGPAMAIFSVWTFARITHHPSQFGTWVFLSTLPVIVLTGARTALLAVVIAIILGTALTSTGLGRNSRQILSGLLSTRFILPIGLLILPAALFAPEIAKWLTNFLQKTTEASNLLEAYEESRGGLISTMWANIQMNPLTGIGFGIASEPEYMSVQYFNGIPISAVVEKGVLPVAIVEELGILGSIFVLVWLAILLIDSKRSGVESVIVLLAVLLLNLGEATLFSPGGMGLLSVVLVGWAVSRKASAVRAPMSVGR